MGEEEDSDTVQFFFFAVECRRGEYLKFTKVKKIHHTVRYTIDLMYAILVVYYQVPDTSSLL